MSNDRFDVLDRLAPLFEAPEPSFEAFLRRRDRKRRNQRIAAGVVGIAVFVAAVWIVTSVGSFDRTQTPAVPGGAETGPEVSGPTSTDPSVAPDAGWMFSGLPPEGTPLSTPEEGELVAHYDAIQGAGFVFVYADGRVISHGGVAKFRPGRRLRATPHARGSRAGAVRSRKGGAFPVELQPSPGGCVGGPRGKALRASPVCDLRARPRSLGHAPPTSRGSAPW